MFKMNPSDMKKMMKRMGINVDVEEVKDAERVLIETSGDKNFVVEQPSVTFLKMKGQTIIYVIGSLKEIEKEETTHQKRELEILEDDVQLVAAEAGVSLEEARKALEITNGDIAQAIMLLSAKKG
ncbi:nascent polypeptide-associated complex protein [Fervidicoccus fontis]|jgi:nascent polypeptide-associated complex subunit alpha|uniref:Nascent polypeptide-associated complex protein n=2 Tax=Fervidicoccus fontis TaxID=683846 RepID=I0A265_FERFK|nr:nascent polypeptide-associated complex protein [Fervidicoccus fontis]AFH43072.1 nascent polypeptide-associated complex protein [Fervidicoccus fontis Kam940]MBE9391374.1 nascent polypeptide-associated complex protein [Fervidicoccus fontis]PMB75605.1 MAG: nascent polypeptide-associated complex protein [Fervidicoccus fontis]HEW64102.1 nascent polypeptide-associated complex protein [Fervidicoccus fontis]